MPDATLEKVDAAVWTAIGLLAATSLGTMFYLGARIDALGGRMDSRFDAVAGRFDSLEGRFDSRFDALEGRMEARFAHVDARFDALDARLDAHLDRHAG
jgi:hypothetical protein